MFTSKKEHLALLLFVLVKFGEAFIPEFECAKTCEVFKNEKFNNYCHKVGSCDWYCAAQRMNCLAPLKYHCARADGYPEQFVNVCAIQKLCGKGEEPSIKVPTAPNEQAKVNCIPCVDKNVYNDRDQLMSTTFSLCPYNKVNQCTKENHKIDCGPERGKQAWNVQTESDGFCRCDARAGYEPKFKDVLINGTYCFYDKVACIKKVCPVGMEVSLNYTCFPKCPEGQGRNQLSDICTDLLPPTIFTTTNATTNIVTSSPEEKNSTLATTPPATQKFEGDKKNVYLYIIIVLLCLGLSAGAGYFGWKMWKIHKKKKERRSNNTINVEELVEMLETTTKETPDSDLRRNEVITKRTVYNKINETKNIGGEINITGGTTNINLYLKDSPEDVPLLSTGGTLNIDAINEIKKMTECPTPPIVWNSASSKGSFQDIRSKFEVPRNGVEEKGQKWQSHDMTERQTEISQPSDTPEDDIPFCDDPPEKIPFLKTTRTHGNGLKPVDLIEGPEPDADGGITHVGVGVISEDEMEKLAENILSGIYNLLKASNDSNLATASNDSNLATASNDSNLATASNDSNLATASNDSNLATASNDSNLATASNDSNLATSSNDSNLATIESFLEKMTANEKVKLAELLNFPERMDTTPKRFKDDFRCKHCGRKFFRGNSSGNNNSCMYQSVSILLCGDERLQNRLRLCSTLHAVRRFKDYVKQLEAIIITGNETSPYDRVLEIFAPADIKTSGIQDWKLCLREGIRKLVVETSESTRDSSQLHIMFLSHALRCKIIQHFEDSSHHEDTEDCPVLEGDTANTLDILDLHILWNKELNHLMPLFQVST